MAELFPLAISSPRVHMHEFAFAYVCVNDPEASYLPSWKRRDYYVENGDKDGCSTRKEEVRIFMNVVILYLRTTRKQRHGSSYYWNVRF